MSFMLNSAEHAQLSWAWKAELSMKKALRNCWYFYFYDLESFITSGPDCETSVADQDLCFLQIFHF